MKTRDRTKLPKWAQDEIARLERDLLQERTRLAAGPEDSNVFADPYATVPRPLGQDTMIEFRLNTGPYDKVSVRHERDRVTGRDAIYVMGSGTVSIEPQSGNTFKIRLTR